MGLETRKLMVKICDPRTGEPYITMGRLFDVQVCDFCGQINPIAEEISMFDFRGWVEDGDKLYCPNCATIERRRDKRQGYARRATREALTALEMRVS